VTLAGVGGQHKRPSQMRGHSSPIFVKYKRQSEKEEEKEKEIKSNDPYPVERHR
jgi:hypothetical protein